jgi:hypothetical protein
VHSFGNVLFFLLLALVLMGTNTLKDARNDVQNDFWTAKFGFWIGCLVVPFFMPNSVFAGYGTSSSLHGFSLINHAFFKAVLF